MGETAHSSRGSQSGGTALSVRPRLTGETQSLFRELPSYGWSHSPTQGTTRLKAETVPGPGPRQKEETQRCPHRVPSLMEKALSLSTGIQSAQVAADLTADSHVCPPRAPKLMGERDAGTL